MTEKQTERQTDRQDIIKSDYVCHLLGTAQYSSMHNFTYSIFQPQMSRFRIAFWHPCEKKA